MEKFSQFGVEPILLLAQIVNFLLLVYLLKRFLYKPILEVLKRREQRIQEGLAAADHGEKLLLQARKEEKAIVSKAGEEAHVLLEESKQRVLQREERMLSEAKQEAEALIARGKQQIKEEEEIAMKKLEKKVLVTAIDVVEKILPKALSRDDHIRIIKSSTKMLSEMTPP